MNINIKRFNLVFGRIFAAYEQRSGIYATHDADTFGPQRLDRPKGTEIGDSKHLYWLTLAGLSDRRTDSSSLYPRMATMFDQHPELFIQGQYPTFVELETLYRTYKIGVPVNDIGLFIKRKRHLDEFFAGDPLRIYDECTTATEVVVKMRALARKHNLPHVFPGAKEKMFSLLAMFLSEITDLRFSDLVPIDTWVQSVVASTGVLRGTESIKVSALEKMLRPPMTRLFSTFRDVPGAANATWIHGRKLCDRCGSTDMSKLCPVYDLCKGPFARMRHAETDRHIGRIAAQPKFRQKAGK